MHASNSAIYQTIYELQTPLHNTFLKKKQALLPKLWPSSLNRAKCGAASRPRPTLAANACDQNAQK